MLFFETEIRILPSLSILYFIFFEVITLRLLINLKIQLIESLHLKSMMPKGGAPNMKRLIIVDDSKTFRKVMERILSPFYEIVGAAQDGAEGIELFLKTKPDLVLMDITMPNTSGKEALAKILEMDRTAKVIMVSGVGDDTTVKECLQIGAKAFVSKSKITSTDGIGSPLCVEVEKVIGFDAPEKVAA